MRQLLSQDKISKGADAAMAAFHGDVVKTVADAAKANEWTVIGMAGNPHVKQARKHLAAKGKTFTYLEYGGYLSQWKQRLAIKLWSGWPTFPQVFHKGVLVGGCDDLLKYLP